MLLLWLVPLLAGANVGDFRWSTPYPDGRTQDLLAVVSSTEFFMAASKISGIHHFRNGVWSFIDPPPSIPPNPRAKCIASRLSGSKVMVIIEGNPVTFNEYSVGAGWSQTSLRQLQNDSALACFMTNNALFLAGKVAAVYDLGQSVKYRPSNNLCDTRTGCHFIAGNAQVVYTFTGPNNTRLLKYEAGNWSDVGKVNLTLDYIESLALAADGTVYAAGNDVLAQSKDGGKNWTRILKVDTVCASPEDNCNQAIYAANNVVLLGSFSPSGLYAYNLSNEVAFQRNFEGRAIVAGGIANTAFVMGAYGAVWQTSMIADSAAPVTQLSRGILVDYYPAGTGLCQLRGISGSAESGKVYAVTSGCGDDKGSVYSSDIPMANSWTRFGPLQEDFEDALGIFALPFSDDIWIWSPEDIYYHKGGTWTPVDTRLNGPVAVHGYQTSSTQSSVFLLFQTFLAIATSAGFTSVNDDPGDTTFAALHVANSSLLFIGAVNGSIGVSTNGGLSIIMGSNPFSPPFPTSPPSPETPPPTPEPIKAAAIYYRKTADVIIVAALNGLWQSVGGVAVRARTWVQVTATNRTLDMPFDSIWARNENDIYASGTTLNVIWHFFAGNWTAIPTPLDPQDSYLGDPDFGVRGIWGTAAGDTYAATRVGVISSPVDTDSPTTRPTVSPTKFPTLATPAPTPPTQHPSRSPTSSPTSTSPTPSPTTLAPTLRPSRFPTPLPTRRPSKSPITQSPSSSPTIGPSLSPTLEPSFSPSSHPSTSPSRYPSASPTIRECLCVDDCVYKGLSLTNNGVCEDAGPGGRGYEFPELAACVFGHDCADCGTANRTSFKNPISCEPRVRPPSANVDSISDASQLSVLVCCLTAFMSLLVQY